MNLRQGSVLAAVFLLGCLTVGAFLGRPAAAEPKAEATTPGRYQIVALANGNVYGTVVVMDTTSGECWGKDHTNGVWSDWEKLNSPAKAK